METFLSFGAQERPTIFRLLFSYLRRRGPATRAFGRRQPLDHVVVEQRVPDRRGVPVIEVDGDLDGAGGQFHGAHARMAARAPRVVGERPRGLLRLPRRSG
jgi:hypothetical protein